MASLVDGHHVVSMRHSVASPGDAAPQQGGPRALLHFTLVEPHLGSVAAGMPGPKDIAVELSRGQLDTLVAQLQRLAEHV
jgi:hypothetical protein